MKIYVEEEYPSSRSSLLHLAKDKNSTKLNKMLTKLEPYLIKKTHTIDIYSKQGMYQVSENQTYKMYIKSEKNHKNIVLNKNDKNDKNDKNITLVIDESVIEKEIVHQLPYDHINIPLIVQKYSLNKNTKNMNGIFLVIEFIDNTNNNENANANAMPINYYFEYNSQNGNNMPLEDINVFLSLLN
jgi:hypothetical protein